MASVVGLLEERELAARVRVEALREEADRVLAELAAAETDWEGWVIARQRVGQVLSASSTPEGSQPVAPVLPVASRGAVNERVTSPKRARSH